MLDALRKGAGTWVAKIFLVLLVLSFAAWGIADVFRGFQTTTAAKVGDAEVSLIDFERSYRQPARTSAVDDRRRAVRHPATGAGTPHRRCCDE